MNPITMNGYNYANNNPVMMVDPDGEWAVVIGAVVGALINAIIYYVGLINKHGFKNAHKNIKLGALPSTVILGAASGALGFGVVKVLAKKGALTAIGERLLSLHIAPAAYAIGNYGSYNAKGVTENQILSQFGKKSNIIYQVFKPILQKIISNYKRK